MTMENDNTVCEANGITVVSIPIYSNGMKSKTLEAKKIDIGVPNDKRIATDKNLINGTYFNDAANHCANHKNLSNGLDSKNNIEMKSINSSLICESESIIKNLLSEMVSLIDQTAVPSQILKNGGNFLVGPNLNSYIKKKNVSLPTSSPSLRTSKRKRIPKKLDDEEKKAPSPPIVLVKEKAPIVETPILYLLGDLVWSYVPGHPLWPCMLTNDPLVSACTKMQGGLKPCRAYHVQFLGDSPEHGWVRETRVFPFKSPEDYDKIIADLLQKSKKMSIKVPRIEIPTRLKDDWDSGIEEILEASEFTNEDRIIQYEYDFKPYMKEFKHLYSRRNKIRVYKDCKKLLKELISQVCDDSHASLTDVDSSDVDEFDSIDYAVRNAVVADQNNCNILLNCSKDLFESESESLQKQKLIPPDLIAKSGLSCMPEEIDFSAFPSAHCQSQCPSDFSDFIAASKRRTVSPVQDQDSLCSSKDNSLSKAYVFKTYLNLIKKEANDTKDENNKTMQTLLSTYTSKLVDACTCTALTQKKTLSRVASNYSHKDLIQGVQAIQNGLNLLSVSLYLKIPRSTLNDYVKKRTVKVRHHSKCRIFSCGSTTVSDGVATHVVAKNNSNVQLRSGMTSSFKPRSARKAVKSKKRTRLNHKESSKWLLKRSGNRQKNFKKNATQKIRPARSSCHQQTFEQASNLVKSGASSTYQVEPGINKMLDESQNLLSLSGDSRCPGFTNAEILLAWQNYILQVKTSKQETLLEQAFNQVAEGGMSLEEAVCVFGIAESDFKNFVKHYMPFQSIQGARKVKKETKSSSETPPRKYNCHKILVAIDDVKSKRKTLTFVAQTNSIPVSTLRDCINHNKAVYEQIITSKMSRQKRIETLKQNASRFRMPRSIRNPKPAKATFNSSLSAVHKSSSTSRISRQDNMQNEVSASTTRKTGSIYDTPSSFKCSNSKLLVEKAHHKRQSEKAFLDYLESKKIPFILKTFSSWGWSFSLNDVRTLIIEYLDEQDDFNQDKHLSDLFLLTLCRVHSILCDVSSNVSEHEIDQFKVESFFNKIHFLMYQKNMKKHPSNVFVLQEHRPRSSSTPHHCVVLAANASGSVLPPLTIFPGDFLWCSEKAYPDSQFALQSNCQFTIKLLTQWLKRFLSLVPYRPLVLIYDGHLTSLPLLLVQTLYESNCVFLKLPYSSMLSKLQLPYTNIVSDALSISKKDFICPSSRATPDDVIASIRDFWTNHLTSDVICKTFISSCFFSPAPDLSEQNGRKIKFNHCNESTTMNVELKQPPDVISSSSVPMPSVLRSRCESTRNDSHSSISKDQVASSQDTSAPSQKQAKPLAVPDKASKRFVHQCTDNRNALRESRFPRRNLRRDRVRRRRRLSSKRKLLSGVTAAPLDQGSSVAPSQTKDKTKASKIDFSSDDADDVPLAKAIAPKRHPVADRMSKLKSSLENSDRPKEDAEESNRGSKIELLDPEPSLFSSYYNKRCGPLKTERPNLTPAQVRARIEMEWESLSPSRQQKYGKNDSNHSSTAQKSPVSVKKRKKSVKAVHEQSAIESLPSENQEENENSDFKCSTCGVKYATKLSLSQHKRWCFQPKRKRKRSIPKVTSKSNSLVTTEKKSVDCLFKCDLCHEKFFSSNSLQIHKKFCTAEKQAASAARSSSIKKSLKTIRNRSKISQKPGRPVILNGDVQRKSHSSSAGRKKDTSSAVTDKSFETENDKSDLDTSLPNEARNDRVKSSSSTPVRRGKARGRPQLGSNAKRESLCTKCATPGGELVQCVGGCCQSIHVQCIDGGKPKNDEPYTCQNCVSQSHPCFICKVGPADDRSDLGKIKRCNVPHCGRSYHTTCLQSWKLAMMVAADEDNDGNRENYSILNNYRCPMHTCATCTSRFTDNLSSANTSGCRMFRCIRCPTAYHAGDDCIAAGSVILPGLNIICPDHFEPLKTTPYHQPVHVSWCFVCSKGGELVCCETCPAAFHAKCVNLEKPPEGEWFCRDCRHRRRPLYGDIVWVKLGSYRWWPGEITHPNDIPDNIKNLRHDIGEFVVNFFGSNDYFWLNRRRVFAYQEGDTGASTAHCSRGISSVFNKALLDASHKFKELSNQRQKLHEVKTQKKRPQYKFIKTNKPVGNVQVYTADLSELPRCICKRTDSNPCGPDSECLNRMLMYECHPTLCPAGDKCQNQHFQKRDYPQSEVFKTSWGGWGLKTLIPVKKGQFVNEYVGELVDNEECMRRIEQAHKNNVTNFYMLTIDKDRIIDAGPKGNLSRFMNHCCNPSCETQKWTVNGDTRVGLFARRDIKPGEELTFNYNLDCLGNDKTPCMCGSNNCSGFIGVRPKPQQLDSGRSLDNKTKKKRRRTDQRDLPKHDDFCFRCRQVGTLVCCDVRGCQRAFCLSCLRLTKPPFGKWECPWHHCDFCGRRAQSFCHFCPNSFCASHVMNQLVLSVPNQYDCCIDHDPNVAEYEMEEAIAAVVASMLPAENWAEKAEEELKKEKADDKETVEAIPDKPKIGQAKVASRTSSSTNRRKSRATKKVKKEQDPVEVDLPAAETSAASSLDDSLLLTESDIELGPPTTSPVRRKRIKRQYFRGSKKRRKSKQRLFNASSDAVETQPEELPVIKSELDHPNEIKLNENNASPKKGS